MATLTVPHQCPSPVEDAEQLMQAVKGFGTDEKAVINILAHRNAEQRRQIRLAYEERFNEDLTKRLESELKGEFEKAVYRWNFPPLEREAILANVAVREKIDYTVIIETACVNTPQELLAVKNAYQTRYKRCLEEDIAVNCSGDLRKFLLGLVGTYRYNGDEVDLALASSEAKIIKNAFREKAFHHDEIFRIITTRSRAQLNATFNKYRDEFGTSLTEALASDPKNELAIALTTAIECFISPHEYFEKVLRNATSKSGSNENGLTRVIVTRAEKDLKIIKDLYYKKNSVTLEQAVAKVTSGDYEKFLLALIGSN